MLYFLLTAIFGVVLGSSLTYFIVFQISQNKLNILKKSWEFDRKTINEKSKNLEINCDKLTNELISLRDYCSIKSKKFTEIIVKKSVLEEIASNVPKLEKEVQREVGYRNQIIQANIELEKEVAELKTLLKSEYKHSNNEKTIFIDTKNKMMEEFKNILASFFQEEGKIFLGDNKTQIKAILTPLKEQLFEFKKKVEDVYDKDSRDRSVLVNEIYKLKLLNKSISKDAINLTKALKGDVKVQGCWGELVLERLLELSGLQKGRSYNVQVQFKQASGDRYKPDAIIHLPEGKDVVVDSKVSLKNYEQYCSSDNEIDKKVALKKHLISLKTHIRELNSKNYDNLEGIKSLDFILMFIPIEEAFFIAIKNEISLIPEAFKNNVFIVCPSTLLITLRTINNIWRDVDQNKNAAEIARQAGEMYDKFIGFINSIDDIGVKLFKATSSYELAKKRLLEGRGNLIKRAEDLKSLGLKTKKKIPKSFKNDNF